MLTKKSKPFFLKSKYEAERRSIIQEQQRRVDELFAWFDREWPHSFSQTARPDDILLTFFVFYADTYTSAGDLKNWAQRVHCRDLPLAQIKSFLSEFEEVGLIQRLSGSDETKEVPVFKLCPDKRPLLENRLLLANPEGDL